MHPALRMKEGSTDTGTVSRKNQDLTLTQMSSHLAYNAESGQSKKTFFCGQLPQSYWRCRRDTAQGG